MRARAYLTGIAMVSALAMGATASLAKGAESAQSKTCWARAKGEGLTGSKRDAFHATCMKGALAPKHPVRRPTTAASAAITAPSGADKDVRSKACSDEGSKRGLQASAFDAFRKSCLATAGPVSEIGGGGKPSRPTPAKSKIENLTNTPPH